MQTGRLVLTFTPSQKMLTEIVVLLAVASYLRYRYESGVSLANDHISQNVGTITLSFVFLLLVHSVYSFVLSVVVLKKAL